MSKTDKWLIIGLLVVSLALHFISLNKPREVVFDEVHFGKFVTAYCCTGERFFDIHPPHAKLLVAGVAYLGGYRGGFDFDHIGEPYGSVPITALRFVPALAGTLLPLVVFWLARQLGARPWAAAASAGLVLLDNALTVQARLISLDSILLLAIFSSLLLFLKSDEKWYGWKRWVGFGLAGGWAGLAVGVKFTGLAILGLLGVIIAVRLLRTCFSEDSPAFARGYGGQSEDSKYRMIRHYILAGLLIVFCASVVYAAGWALHFALLSAPGGGDAFYRPDFSGGALPITFIRETVALHKVMFDANYHLTATHPYASAWWSWLLMERPIFYWQEAGRMIYLLGNPLVWWGTNLMLLIIIVLSVVRYGQDRTASTVNSVNTVNTAQPSHKAMAGKASPSHKAMAGKASPSHKAMAGKARTVNTVSSVNLWIPVMGYVIALGPLIDVPRALFLYHYFTALIFAMLIVVLWLQRAFDTAGWDESRRRKVWITVLIAVAIVFVVFSPLTYGLAVPTWWADNLFWLRSWR
ncbi:MAG: phospholipid carrier-dependent glycosyltransferase [Candidatus Andersenbacteria bacterium]|nr:phospholipid carrier-dependent glycosyltransferase [Candidatus Andersenbacteria bacterium]